MIEGISEIQNDIERKLSKTFLAVLHSRALLNVQLQMSVLFVVPDLGFQCNEGDHVKDDDDGGGCSGGGVSC